MTRKNFLRSHEKEIVGETTLQREPIIIRVTLHSVNSSPP